MIIIQHSHLVITRTGIFEVARCFNPYNDDIAVTATNMPSHRSISNREKRLIELFGPEKLKKDLVIEKKLAKYFGDCTTKNRTLIRDATIKKN